VVEWPGEKEAWEILSGLDSQKVTTNAEASYHSCDSAYELPCFGQDIRISLADRTILGRSSLGTSLVNGLGEYSRLSILRYLIHAKDLPPSGQLVRPADLPGGGIFVKGTHVLPLENLATSFADHPIEFAAIGKSLGGSQVDHGDMSLELFPFPRVPVVLIVWSGDEEFSANASLLFDARCGAHLPIDIVWSTAMMSIEMMLIDTKAHNKTSDDTA